MTRPGPAEAPPPATQAVAREDLSSVVPVDATLGYAGSYTVLGQGGGTLTWLPSAGRVIGQGQVLYRVDNGSPVVLLYGPVPDWRTLHEGLTGADVTQLNHDLVALGYADGADISALGWDYFSWETAYGIQRMESALGVASPAGVAAARLGGVRAGRDPGHQRAGQPRRPGDRTGAGGDLRPARGDDRAQHRAGVGGGGGGRGHGHAAGRRQHAGEGLLGRRGGLRVGGQRDDPGARSR